MKRLIPPLGFVQGQGSPVPLPQPRSLGDVAKVKHNLNVSGASQDICFAHL